MNFNIFFLAMKERKMFFLSHSLSLFSVVAFKATKTSLMYKTAAWKKKDIV